MLFYKQGAGGEALPETKTMLHSENRARHKYGGYKMQTHWLVVYHNMISVRVCILVNTDGN